MLCIVSASFSHLTNIDSVRVPYSPMCGLFFLCLELPIILFGHRWETKSFHLKNYSALSLLKQIDCKGCHKIFLFDNLDPTDATLLSVGTCDILCDDTTSSCGSNDNAQIVAIYETGGGNVTFSLSAINDVSSLFQGCV